MTTSAFTCRGQDDTPSQLIRTFYEKIYRSTISPEQIVQDYIVYSDTSGYRNAVESIRSLRHPLSNANEHFSLLKKDIESNNFTLAAYPSFDEKEKALFQYLADDDRINIYRLSPQHTIRQYILVKGSKIRSFFGFQKTGADNYTFIVYE
jgi:hypothetical protein